MIEDTQRLAARIRQALADEGDLGPTETTLDVTAIPGYLEADTLTVLVNPPTRTWHTYSHWTDAHKVWVIAPTTDVLPAWERLSPAVEAIALATSADEAEPSSFADPHGTTYPAYIITIADA